MKRIAGKASAQKGISLDWVQWISYVIIYSSFQLNLFKDG